MVTSETAISTVPLLEYFTAFDIRQRRFSCSHCRSDIMCVQMLLGIASIVIARSDLKSRITLTGRSTVSCKSIVSSLGISLNPFDALVKSMHRLIVIIIKLLVFRILSSIPYIAVKLSDVKAKLPNTSETRSGSHIRSSQSVTI